MRARTTCGKSLPISGLSRAKFSSHLPRGSHQPVQEMPGWFHNRDRDDNWTLHILGFQLTQLDQVNFIGAKVYFQSLFQRKKKKKTLEEIEQAGMRKQRRLMGSFSPFL